MIYNVHYDICAMMIAAFAIVFILVKKGLRLAVNKILFLLLTITFFAAFFDVASSITNSYIDKWSFAMRDLTNYAYLTLQNAMAVLFCIYTACVCGLLYDSAARRKFIIPVTVPYVVDLLALLFNPFLKWVYYYDADKAYLHGPAFYVLYVNAFLYLIVSAVIIFRHGKNVARSKKVICFMFIFGSSAAVGVQIIIPHVLLALCVESLCMLGALLVMDSEDEITDAVSRCFNRRFFIDTNTQRLGNSLKYSILIVRIRQLHFHTATLGIDLTGKVIRQVGEFLMSLHREVEVYSYDNGAFALLYSDDGISDEIMERIDRRFEENWGMGDTRINLEISRQKIRAGEQVSQIEELLLVVDADSAGAQPFKESEESVSVLDYRRELSVERAIRRALATDGFAVHYQPIWDSKKNMITRAEVLLQLEDEELGVISPGEFIPIAEKKGFSIEIGKVLLQKVCKMYRERDLEELGIEVIEMKTTRLQCMNANLGDMALDIAREYGVDPAHFGFQVSTDTLIDNQKEVISNLNKLKQAGFRLSIDDYGRPAMCLLDLFGYPIDCVRIDKHFLWQAMKESNITILFKNTVRMLREMRFLTIAEGVEDVYQKELAVEMNCELLQGFFFSKSVGEEGFYRYCRGFNLR